MTRILFDLLAKKQVTAGDLAVKYEVALRTVYRYIEELEFAGVPIERLRGANGGFRILPTFKLASGFLTKAEYDATLSALTIGSLTLTPAFDAEQTEYTAATTNTKNKVTATATDSAADVSLKLGDEELENGTDAPWETGENTVTVTVKNGKAEKVYTVTVTKS